MIEDKFIGDVDLIVDEYDLNACEKLIRIVLARSGSKRQAEMVLIIEGDYKMYFEPRENYVLTTKQTYKEIRRKLE